MEETIQNKVAASGLITINLEEMKPKWEIVGFDIAQCLFEGLLLREKEFRAFISSNDWSAFHGKHVHVYCSTDAIIPTWAYMLLSVTLSDIAASIIFGTQAEMELSLWRKFLDNLDEEKYIDKRVVIKGCSDEEIAQTVYLELATKLKPVVKSLMFGEPCSTVPIFKAKS